jgi:hypothetical protein
MPTSGNLVHSLIACFCFFIFIAHMLSINYVAIDFQHILWFMLETFLTSAMPSDLFLPLQEVDQAAKMR